MDARLQAPIMAIGHVLMALIFILSGLSKIGAADAVRSYMEAMGVPALLLWPTIAFEIGAGALVALRYRTRVVALLLAGFCPLSAATFYHQFADQIQVIMFPKNVSMAGGFLLLAAVGPGSLGLDAR